LSGIGWEDVAVTIDTHYATKEGQAQSVCSQVILS